MQIKRLQDETTPNFSASQHHFAHERSSYLDILVVIMASNVMNTKSLPAALWKSVHHFIQNFFWSWKYQSVFLIFYASSSHKVRMVFSHMFLVPDVGNLYFLTCNNVPKILDIFPVRTCHRQ